MAVKWWKEREMESELKVFLVIYIYPGTHKFYLSISHLS